MFINGDIVFKILLWDMDGTLLDFIASEKYAIKKVFSHFGFELSDCDVAEYSKINDSYWTRFDKGEIKKGEIYSNRFADFFRYLGALENSIPDWRNINELYQNALGDYFVYNEDSYEVVSKLKDGRRQYIVTNGSLAAQTGRLKLSGFGELVDGVFISETMGLQKPSKEFFDACFQQIPGFLPEDAIIIGDSLTSDIKGGNIAGVKTCWYNPGGKTPDIDVKIDFEITRLSEVLDIV